MKCANYNCEDNYVGTCAYYDIQRAKKGDIIPCNCWIELKEWNSLVWCDDSDDYYQ